MKKTLLYGLAVIVTLALASCAFAARISPDVAKLLDSRQINCWVEGELLGDIVLGSRGSIQFIYLDEAMSLAIRDDHTLAPWVDDMNQYYGSAGTNKKALFVVQLESNKPWNVEISNCWSRYSTNSSRFIESSPHAKVMADFCTNHHCSGGCFLCYCHPEACMVG